MKQHITIDQLNELSDKGKERLHEWFYANVAEHDFIVVNPDYDPQSQADDWEEGILFHVDDHKDGDIATTIEHLGLPNVCTGELRAIRYRDSSVLPLLTVSQMI